MSKSTAERQPDQPDGGGQIIRELGTFAIGAFLFGTGIQNIVSQSIWSYQEIVQAFVGVGLQTALLLAWIVIIIKIVIGALIILSMVDNYRTIRKTKRAIE